MAFSTITTIVGSNAFGNYVDKAIAENSDIMQSGAVEVNGDFAAAIRKNGGFTAQTVTVPSLAEVSGDSSDITDGTAVTESTVAGKLEILPAVAKIKSFGFYDSTTDLTGADPAKTIANSIGKYWARESKKILGASLNGLFGANGVLVSELLLDASTEVLTLDILAAAQNLLGDCQDKLSTIWCHSAIASKLRGLAKSGYVSHPAEGKSLLGEFQGKKVVADDYMAATSGVYPVYLLTAGSLVCSPLNCANEYEAFREPTYSRTTVIGRKRLCVGARGVKFTVPANRTSGANGASNTELGTVTNWTKVLDAKQIGIVKLLVRVEAAAAAPSETPTV